MAKTTTPKSGRAGGQVDGEREEGSQPPAVVDKADPKEAKAPPSHELVPAYPEDVYRALSAADERQIVQELQGAAPKEMLYSFMQDGNRVLGLSWKGVREAVRVFNVRGKGRIRISEKVVPIFEDVTVSVNTGKRNDTGQPIIEDRRAVSCLVYAVDEMHGGGNYGTATQLHEFKLSERNKRGKDKEGNPIWMPDPFARTKALSKAERNALEPFIPLELVEELKVLYLGQGKVEYLPGIGAEVAEPRPALDDPKGEALIAECRELYAELKRIAGLAVLPPARFDGYLRGVWHSQQRLEDYAEHLRTLIADAKAQQKEAKT